MSWGELFAFLMFVLELLKFFWRILCSVIGFMSKKRSNRHSAKYRLFLITKSLGRPSPVGTLCIFIISQALHLCNVYIFRLSAFNPSAVACFSG